LRVDELNELYDLLLVFRRLQVVDEAVVPDETADASEKLDVLALVPRRGEEDEEDPDGILIGCAEGDRLGSGQGHADDLLLESGHGGMRNGEPRANHGGMQLLSFEELLLDYR
jgi:hypothetical protein